MSQFRVIMLISLLEYKLFPEHTVVVYFTSDTMIRKNTEMSIKNIIKHFI